jgi:two-component system, sensor histidine kinase RegB
VTASFGQARTNLEPPRAGTQEQQIILRWLARLRWLAVCGQAIATWIAVFVLHLRLPTIAIECLILLTVLSNLGISFWRHRTVPPWLVPGILVLDVGLLTALLICSGGPSNPLSALYLVHVAMAVVTLRGRGPWIVVAWTAACYGLLFVVPWSKPLRLSEAARATADWVALVLVSIVTAYFVGRTTASLRRRERELADARERAGRNEQLAALTTLAAGAAHELNTPLSTIAVVAKELELQSKQMSLANGFADDARLIRQEVDRCQIILGRMRADILQGEWQKRTEIGAMEFVEQLRKELHLVAGESLRIECAKDLKQIDVPVRAVQQTLGILVDNALDASPEDKDVRLAIFSRENRLIFEVEDQGAGMADEVIRRAGEPFFTTKPPGQGMGLGLFLARLVAEKLGGSLKLSSEPGKGTRAVFELPAEQL